LRGTSLIENQFMRAGARSNQMTDFAAEDDEEDINKIRTAPPLAPFPQAGEVAGAATMKDVPCREGEAHMQFTRILRQIYLPRLFRNAYHKVSINRSSREKTKMRHFTLATGLALAIATIFSLAPARAEFGGAIFNDQGQCRQYGANNQNLTYYYWDKCPSTKVGTHGHVHVNGGTSHHHTHS
jgi:hypothetical protein